MGAPELAFERRPPPQSAREAARLAWLRRRLPRSWIRTGRRRRLLFLALAAPGFLAVFATTLHRSLWLLLAGLLAFGAAAWLRAITEPLFVRSAGEPPQSTPDLSKRKESRDA